MAVIRISLGEAKKKPLIRERQPAMAQEFQETVLNKRLDGL